VNLTCHFIKEGSLENTSTVPLRMYLTPQLTGRDVSKTYLLINIYLTKIKKKGKN